MNAMTRLNKMLSEESERTKLSSALESYSIEELEAVLRAEGMGQQKTAADLTAKGRDQIKTKNFALPEEKKYPIHDESHARNALARVSAHGTPEEKERVRAAVARKWPGVIGEQTKKDLEKKSAAKKSHKGQKTDRERAEDYSNAGAALGAFVGSSRSPLGGALAGYGAGRLTHRLIHGPVTGKKLEKKGTMVKVSAELEDMAAKAGALLAKTSAPSGLVSPLMKGVKAVGQGLGRVMGNTTARNAAMGAAGGAALGAAKGALDPNSTMAGGALKGAVGGAALGAGAKAGITAMGGMQNRVGRLTRGVIRRGGTPMPKPAV